MRNYFFFSFFVVGFIKHCPKYVSELLLVIATVQVRFLASVSLNFLGTTVSSFVDLFRFLFEEVLSYIIMCLF